MTAAAASSSSSSAFAFTRDCPFEIWFVARRETANGRQYKILQCFPGAPHQIEQKFPKVVRFCFPDRPKPLPGDPPMKALRFTFVLTNEFGRRLFGHVFQPLSGDMICFVSKFCWVELFDEIFYRYRMNGERPESILAFYDAQVPDSNGVFCSPTVNLSSSAAASSSSSSSSSSSPPAVSIAEGLRRPPDSGNAFANVRLPSVLEFLSNDTLLRALAALMCESRLVVVGRRVADISDVVLGLVALLQPFDWEHVLIPVLPNDLLDVLCSPTPFLMGLLTNQVPEASRLPMEDVTVVVLGRDGGVGSFVRKGIPLLLQHHDTLVPAASSHPHALSTSNEQQMLLTEEQKREIGGMQQSPDDDEQGGGGGNNNNHPSAGGGGGGYFSREDMILMLPFTESRFSSIRVGLFQARRLHEAGREYQDKADEALLAAFQDYYVFTFGLIFAADFTPQNYCVRMVKRGGEYQSPAAESNTKEFFDRVSQGMMMADMRATMLVRLKEADKRAMEIKKNYWSQAAMLRVNSTATPASAVEEKRRKFVSDDDGGDSGGESGSPRGHYAFKATMNDVWQIRRIIQSEFLEAVLERYPLLYPHAAQILVHGTAQEEEEQRLMEEAAAADSASSSRTVSRLASSSLLRRFVSWCSYGVTSTVQKLEMHGKTLIQNRSELEEI